MNNTRRGMLLLLALGALSLGALAGCGSVDKAAKPADASGVAEMSPEEMMAKMAELGAPSDGHTVLATMVGEFEVKGTFWMDPAAPPMTNAGSSVHSMVMGGRYLQQEFHSPDFMGMPYTGLGLTGYNNATGEYEGIWLDDSSTAMMPVSTGTMNQAGNQITFSRDFTDVVTGVTSRTREVLSFPDADHHSFEWYQTGPDGVEIKAMMMEYTRK